MYRISSIIISAVLDIFYVFSKVLKCVFGLSWGKKCNKNCVFINYSSISASICTPADNDYLESVTSTLECSLNSSHLQQRLVRLC